MNPTDLKALLLPYRLATQSYIADEVHHALHAILAPDADIKMCHPFGPLKGADAFMDTCLTPLSKAMPDLERRDMIMLAGETPEGSQWVACMGNYMGTFLSPLLDIPPTGHLSHMRYHEFFRIESGKVVEMQAIWDLPELMVQAKSWPMAPQLGSFLCTPAPMTCDGLQISGDGQKTYKHVIAMLEDLCRHPANPDPSIMQLEKYWHPRCNWYGPTGIGSNRGIAGFRNWHQIPFLRAMPDRKLDAMGNLMSHWVAEGNYVCETGWPNMRLTLSHDGWMGIAPAGKEVLLRSLDFWRVENGVIRENWVLVDLLDLYQQIGVDVFARVREFNKARNIGSISVPSGLDSIS
ncbi:ester cyclase [Agarilytica rhodophyticola]|uniref:ester cyclase n=1 Tax=Agarilytica rhodophyticola TaxID=1737490 RepID=UPI000B349E94|nr:ester cyclase [Agarilytica rhodophyticola]